jgi:hypothetical protein
MRDDNDKENQMYSYVGNHFHWYLPPKISNRTSLPLIPGLCGKGRKIIAWATAGSNQKKIFWYVTSP